jgi:Asp-tRNA(Asn)/Glu-tRNA(Gln) amidotransferase A subunit family amidase
VPDHHHKVMAVEAAAYHSDRMRRHPDDYPPKVRSLIEYGQSVTAPEFAITLRHLERMRRDIEAAFTNEQRVFCVPATVGAAPSAETTGDPAFNSPWSYTGLPVVSLPFSTTHDGLPLAVQLVGPRWGEAELLATAALLETDIGFSPRPLPL